MRRWAQTPFMGIWAASIAKAIITTGRIPMVSGCTLLNGIPKHSPLSPKLQNVFLSVPAGSCAGIKSSLSTHGASTTLILRKSPIFRKPFPVIQVPALPCARIQAALTGKLRMTRSAARMANGTLPPGRAGACPMPCSGTTIRGICSLRSTSCIGSSNGAPIADMSVTSTT